MREICFTVHAGIHGIDNIAIMNKQSCVLDLTINFETHSEQPQEVDAEKRNIYHYSPDVRQNAFF